MMAVMEMVAVIPVRPVVHACPGMPPIGIIAPVPRRIPAYPVRAPEPVVNKRSVDIYRFNHVVLAINVLVTDNLHGHIIRRFVLLHINRSHVLVNILRQHSL